MKYVNAQLIKSEHFSYRLRIKKDRATMQRFSFGSLWLFLALQQSQAGSFRGVAETRNLVIGGDEAKQDRHPYMISLQNGWGHICGGSLIAPDVVLTAGNKH